MSTLQTNKPTPRRQQIAPALPIKKASAEFDELALFFENQPPELRFLPTGIAKLDALLGGRGLPSGLVTHWRAPHVFATDALLLEVCRAACERGERVCLVDAANRFDAEVLQVAGLDVFAAWGLFERVRLNTFSQVARLADTWRRGETNDVPGLLVVDSLVAAVGANFGGQQPHKLPASPSKSPRSNNSNASVFVPQAYKQGQMFFRLLCKLDAFARACGAGTIVTEPPVERKEPRSRYRSKLRLSDFLEDAAHDALVEIARVALVLETNAAARGVMRICVAPNCFARTGGSALIGVRDRIRPMP